MSSSKIETKTLEERMLRGAVKGFYDVQKLRIAVGARILQQILSRLDLPMEVKPKSDETPEEKKHRIKTNKLRQEKIEEFLIKLGVTKPSEGVEKQKPSDFMEVIIKDYKGIVDYMTKNHASVKRAISEGSIGIISDETEFGLLKMYYHLMSAEEEAFKVIKPMVHRHPLWINFLQHIRGCGETMAAVIISELDIHKAKYVSAFWKYAGVDVVIFYQYDDDGNLVLDDEGKPIEIAREGRTRHASHQVVHKYIDKNGKEAERKGISFNPFLKTKLLGVLGTSFLRSVEKVYDEDGKPIKKEDGKNLTVPCYYGQVYYDYKHRLNNMSEHDKKTDLHKHNMSVRYMIKYFLLDLFVAWCLIENRIPPPPYHEDKLEMEQHSKTCPALLPLYETYNYAP